MKATARDSLFLVAVTLVAAAPYLGGLGFSSDDWSFLSCFVLSKDQSLPGLIRSLADVRWAILETNGRISFVQRAE